MNRTLIDTGPLVAVLDADDGDHKRCTAAARQLRGELWTTWPVITEGMYLLTDAPAGQDALLQKIEAGDLIVADLGAEDLPWLRALMRKYKDLPIDFADASLVRVAQRENLDTIFTLDRRDFQVYRRDGRRPFRIVP